MFYTKMKSFLSVFFIISVLTTNLWAAPVKIVTVTQDFASIAKVIGGEFVDVVSLIKGSRNLHNINPKPSMVMKVKRADLLIRLGMGQDSWIDGLIQVARNSRVFPGKPGYLDCSNLVKKLEIPDGNIDGRKGDVHKDGNPHYWLNPENGKVIAAQIRDHLVMIDPENADFYASNYTDFEHMLTEKIKEWGQKTLSLREVHFVTYHKVWPYFFDAFKLTSVGELEPLPGIPPTTRHLADLKKRVLSQSSKTIVLTANFYPPNSGASFAKSVNGTHVSVPVSVDETFGITSYVELFETLIAQLKP